ncbi:hypothetical protein ACP275_10G169600 [Erythranthe tilingii]
MGLGHLAPSKVTRVKHLALKKMTAGITRDVKGKGKVGDLPTNDCDTPGSSSSIEIKRDGTKGDVKGKGKVGDLPTNEGETSGCSSETTEARVKKEEDETSGWSSEMETRGKKGRGRG